MEQATLGEISNNQRTKRVCACDTDDIQKDNKYETAIIFVIKLANRDAIDKRT